MPLACDEGVMSGKLRKKEGRGWEKMRSATLGLHLYSGGVSYGEVELESF